MASPPPKRCRVSSEFTERNRGMLQLLEDKKVPFEGIIAKDVAQEALLAITDAKVHALQSIALQNRSCTSLSSMECFLIATTPYLLCTDQQIVRESFRGITTAVEETAMVVNPPPQFPSLLLT